MQKYYPDGFFTSRFNKDYIFYTCIKIHGEICMCMRIEDGLKQKARQRGAEFVQFLAR